MASVGAEIWGRAIEFPFVVRATVGNVSNELVGSYQTEAMARSVAVRFPDWKLFHNVSGKLIDQA